MGLRGDQPVLHGKCCNGSWCQEKYVFQLGLKGHKPVLHGKCCSDFPIAWKTRSPLSFCEPQDPQRRNLVLAKKSRCSEVFNISKFSVVFKTCHFAIRCQSTWRVSMCPSAPLVFELIFVLDSFRNFRYNLNILPEHKVGNHLHLLFPKIEIKTCSI